MAAVHPLFPVALHKFVLMSMFTFGLYDLYWFYKCWDRIKDRSGEDLSPLWRTFFTVIWAFDLFGRVREHAVERGVKVTWTPAILGTLYLLLNLCGQLSAPWSLPVFATFMALVPVARTIAQVNAAASAEEGPNDRYSAWNIAALVVGGPLLTLALIGHVIGALAADGVRSGTHSI